MSILVREQMRDQQFYSTIVVMLCLCMVIATVVAVLMDDPVIVLVNLMFAYAALNMTLKLKRGS